MVSTALQFIDAMELQYSKLKADCTRLAQLQRLQQWQARRLEATYANISLTPRYQDAMRFFLQDLYGTHDFNQRNRDLRKVLAQWEQRLPARAYEAVLFALELEHLTLELDLLMVDAMRGSAPTVVSYATAYRAVGQHAQRQRQIWLVVAAGRALDALVGLPMIGTALRLAKLPARLAGVGVLQGFLERGYAAFERMGGAQELLELIQQRETAIMQRLFAGVRNPFEDAASEPLRRHS